jgi:hypothetical protein
MDNVVGRALIKWIGFLITSNWEIQFFHVYRNTNRSTYIFANLRCNHGANISIYNQPLREMASTIVDDDRRVS